MVRARTVLFALLAMTLVWPAGADTQADAAVARSQAAAGREVPALPFVDAEGKNVTLGDFRGRPVLLTLVYTGCADVCPLVIENLAPAVAVAEEALGEGSFTVLTIGFDSRNDTPARMRSFARAHNAGGKNWRFLSGDTRTLDTLSKTVGFTFQPSAGGFAHMAQVTVIDRNGLVYRQVYGSVFEPPQIVEPLKDLVFGREKPFLSWQGLSDRVKLFCTVYDPASGRYYFNYSLFAAAAIGALSLGLVAGVLVRETRKAFRARRT